MVRIVEEIEEEQFVCAHAERQNTKNTTTCEGVSKQIRGTKRGHLLRQFRDIVDFLIQYRKG